MTGTVLPIKQGGTGHNAKISAFTALSPATLKGELVVSDGELNRPVPAGIEGQVLTADPNEELGVRWGSGVETGTPKCLGSAAPAADTEHVLYTVPLGSGTFAHSLWICNRGAIQTCRVGVKVGGGGTLASADYLFFNLTIPANDGIFYASDRMLCLSALDEVIVRSASAGNLTYKLFGEEAAGVTTRKCLGSQAPSTSETVLYTVPASTYTLVHSIWVCNRSSLELVDFGVSVGGGALANDDYLLKDAAVSGTLVPGFGSPKLLCLGAADEVRVKSAVGNVTYKIFGEERAA